MIGIYIIMTMFICADPMTYTLSIQQFILSLVDILGGNILCVDLTVTTVNFLYVAKMICDSSVSLILYKWEVPHCMQEYWPSVLLFFVILLLLFFETYASMVGSGILFDVMQPAIKWNFQRASLPRKFPPPITPWDMTYVEALVQSLPYPAINLRFCFPQHEHFAVGQQFTVRLFNRFRSYQSR